ncbi:hypothetical protein BDR03DRAFT_987611 [Suillus americanus]|nr:hypothetical protein BDR03DRAFT_987611 [Suillus americanus]
MSSKSLWISFLTAIFLHLLCGTELTYLQVGNVPVHSLVNGLWVGEVPNILSILNLPERLLIALYFPAIYVLKLYPQRKGAKQWGATLLNSGVWGNVSTYQLNTPDIARMVEGDIMPHKPALLAVTITVTIIGPSKLPVKSLPSFLSAALIFLKHENHLYRNIVISEANLALLPEDGVPQDLLTVTKYSDEQQLVEQERAGYVVGDDDDNGMKKLMLAEVLDVFANALANVSCVESYVVQHGSGFINEYVRCDVTGVLYAALEDLRCFDPVLSLTKLTLILQVQKKAFQDNEASFIRLTAKDLALAGRQEAKKETLSNPVIHALKKHLSAVRVNMVSTDESRISICAYIWGMTVLQNTPSLWITINPTDTHNPIVQVFAGEKIDLDLFDRTAGPDSAQRAKIAANDPYAAAKFFHFIVRVIFDELMGIVVLKRGKICCVKAFLAQWRGHLVHAVQVHKCGPGCVKLITNGDGTKHITWYISSYAMKQQQHSCNASTLLAKTIVYHQQDEVHHSDIRTLNKQLLQRVKSHASAEGLHMNAETCNSEVCEYVDRGHEFEQFSYLEHFINTYDIRSAADVTSVHKKAGTNFHVPYLAGTSHVGHIHVLHAEGHETMPHIPGPWFPSANDSDSHPFYCALMLALLKPWRDIRMLKKKEDTFEIAFASFISGAPDVMRTIVTNIQYFHDCANQAKHEEEKTQLTHNFSGAVVPTGDHLDDEYDDEEGPANQSGDVSNCIEDSINDEDILLACEGSLTTQEMVYAEVAMNIADKHNFLASHSV